MLHPVTEGGFTGDWAQPVPGPHDAAMLASYTLLLQNAEQLFPVSVPKERGDGVFENWETVRAGFAARMASTLRHIGYLLPSRSYLDGAALCRTLIDHVITFAWLYADPVAHLPRFVRSSYRRALDVDKERRALGLDDQFLEPNVKRHLRAYVRSHTQDAPGIDKQAEAADAKWYETSNQSVEVNLPRLTTLYRDVYGPFSMVDHPSVVGLRRFLQEDATRPFATVDGSEASDDERREGRPYRMAMYAFGYALVISALGSGRPKLGKLADDIATIAQLADHEHNSRLTFSDVDGRTVVDLASPGEG